MKTMWWDRPPYGVDCPKCGAGRAQPCRNALNKVVAPHKERWEAADGVVIPGLELEVLGGTA